MAATLAKMFGSVLSNSAGIQQTLHKQGLANTAVRLFSTSNTCLAYYVKRTYLKKWGRRDMKRRKLFAEYEAERNALRSIKKSDILPLTVKSVASEDLQKLPLNSCITRMRDRCSLTDRSRGVVIKYRISRIQFRDFADKGLISGVTRSSW